MTWCLPEGESFSPQPTARVAKAITSRFLIVEVKNVLEGLEYLIFVCNYAEVNRGEILQSEKDFITQTARLTPSCVLAAGFVSKEVMVQPIPQSSIPESGKGRGERGYIIFSNFGMLARSIMT